MKKIYFAVIGILIIAGGVYLATASHSNQALDNATNCQKQLTAFEAQVNQNGAAVQNLSSADTKYYDFSVAYSPKLNTCIGGYTESYPDILHGRNSQFDYQYFVYNVLTNSLINVYTTDEELLKHPELKWPGGKDGDLDTASQYAWQDYKAELAQLQQ